MKSEMAIMRTSVIVSGARTPIGKLNGSLAKLSATDLGGIVTKEALRRSGLSPSDIEYVIFGQSLQAGAGQGPARQAAIKGGLPMNIPAVLVNKVCLSGINAIALADQLIRVGEFDVVLAGGMESMTHSPHLLLNSRTGLKLGNAELTDSVNFDGLFCSFDQLSMGEATDKYNQRFAISRQEQDTFAFESHRRACLAQSNGTFNEEIIPVELKDKSGNAFVFLEDEGVRANTTMEGLAQLRPVFSENGTITVGSSSQISDGAAAVVIMLKEKAIELGLEWLCEIGAHATVAGADASLHEQPSDAIALALEKENITSAELDFIEINEAFAAVGIASTKKLGLSVDRVNIHGGAIALGHPLGMSGARLILHIAYLLKNQDSGYGVAALCGGGGQGEALILKR